MKSIYYIICCCIIFFGIRPTAFGQDTTITFQITIPIIAGIDDVEEEEDGTMYTFSTDLELIEDGDEQIVGLHFKDIQIPPGAIINQAYIQFTTDEISTGGCNLEINGEATSNASSFTTIPFDISNRVPTDETVSWSPNNWSVVGANGLAQRTPNIDTIIQELVNQSDWQMGNSINIFIAGSGKRVAESFEGDPNLVAKLVVEASVIFSTENLENIYINELMSLNNAVADEYGETDDWLEIYNDNEKGVILDGIYISDDLADSTKWQFPEPIFIFPKSFALIWLDDAPEQGPNHVPFKLSSGGETVFISQQQGDELVVLDEITFGALSENVSYGRATDGEDNWVYFGNYTPNESNDGSELFLDASINFSIEGGFYSSGTMLTLSSNDPTAEIRYTVDGSLPDQNASIYNNAFTLNSTTLVRARAFKPGYISSVQKEEFYLINNSHDLPVVQISIDPKYLWDEQEGIYITGENGITGNCSNVSPRNWNQDWERPMSIRYFEPDGSEAFRSLAGIKIAGGCSRGFAMKSFSIFFRENKIEYPLFDQMDIQEFKRLKLRMSGNDHPYTMVRDASLHALLYDQVDIDMMAYEPVVVYLNDEYWGFYGLREKFSKHYVESHHGVDKDSIDLLKNPYSGLEIKEGDAVAWDELTSFIENNSMQNLTNYDFVNSKMDIDEFMNYNIGQLYIANYDWPANNVTVWRNRNDGKFRWMLYDLDVSSGFDNWAPSDAQFNAIEHATTTNGTPWPNNPQSTLFLRKILQNQYFQNEFVQRACTFGQTIFAPDRTAHFIDSLTARVASEVPSLITKFNNSPANWSMFNDSPVGGSNATWASNLNKFKTFFEDRMDNVLSNYENFFDIDGHFNLMINFDETTNGTVVFHTNEMKIPYQYNGKYFDEVPIKIKAIPEDGYYFLHWQETGITNAVINYSSSTDAVLTPIFLLNGTVATNDVAEEFVFDITPNPASSTVFFKYKTSTDSDIHLRVYDVMGKKIFGKNIMSSKFEQQISIDVSEWARGVYFLKGETNGKEFVEKLIVGY
ncbi:MAG: CotH kinase family protein [Saprospiraceae bacterium]